MSKKITNDPNFKETKAVFVSTQSSPGPHGHPDKSGQVVAVLRECTPQEADLDETGMMYKIKFADGTETDAFADELTFYPPKEKLTPNTAKKLVDAMLTGFHNGAMRSGNRAIGYTKLTAKTVGFQDLARANCIFVKVHGVTEPNPLFGQIEDMAKANGFRVQTDYGVS
jgi:hypothetical protein